MKAVVLAAGYGTRLYPLTENTPKALLPVAGRPILEHLEQKLLDPALGIQEAVLVSNRRFAETFRQWATSHPSGLRRRPGEAPRGLPSVAAPRPSGLRWTVLDDGTTSDADRLGSMGDLVFAIRTRNLDDDLMILGSDNLFEEGLAGLAALARRVGAVTLGAYELPDRNLASLYGVLTVNAEGQIVHFAEKPSRPASALVSTAVYFFPRSRVGLVLEYVSSRKSADKLGDFIAWLVTQEPVFAYPFRGNWVDIGDIASYKHAQEIFHA